MAQRRSTSGSRGKPRLRILWVGKTGKGFAADGVAHYLGRIAPFAELDCVEIRAAGHSGRDPAQAMKEEADALLRRLGDQERMVLLDERGQALTSPQLAEWIEAHQPCTFVIGGAYGVHPAVAARAQARLSLSRLTLPHQLVRIVLLEQVYRAMTILHGHGYHHG